MLSWVVPEVYYWGTSWNTIISQRIGREATGKFIPLIAITVIMMNDIIRFWSKGVRSVQTDTSRHTTDLLFWSFVLLGGGFLTTRGGDTARWCWFVIASNLFTLFGTFTCFSSWFIELWVDLAPCSPMKSNPMCHCCRMVLCASPTCAT